MKLTILVVILISLLAVPAFAIYVPSDGTTVVAQVATGLYDIYASGTFFFSYPGHLGEYADAEWSRHMTGEWTEEWATNNNDLSVNGTFWDWKGLLPDGTYAEHAFSDAHIYKLRVYVENEFRFAIYDTNYNDNVGGLDVRIEAVPEPSSLLALGTLISPIVFLKWRRK